MLRQSQQQPARRVNACACCCSGGGSGGDRGFLPRGQRLLPRVDGAADRDLDSQDAASRVRLSSDRKTRPSAPIRAERTREKGLQTAITAVNHEQTSLFLLISSIATYVPDASAPARIAHAASLGICRSTNRTNRVLGVLDLSLFCP
jgi:hypothetical protein